MDQATATFEYADIPRSDVDQMHQGRLTWHWDSPETTPACMAPAPDMSILVVDSDSTLLDTVSAVGSEFNAQVFTASNPDEGIELYRAQLPNLVIADYGMCASHHADLLTGLLEIDSSANVVMTA